MTSHNHITTINCGSIVRHNVHNNYLSRLNGSELRGQEEAGLHDEPVSNLQVL